MAARPSSLTRLAEIEGIGKMKTEKYGTAILKLLAPPSEDQPQETFKLEPPQS